MLINFVKNIFLSFDDKELSQLNLRKLIRQAKRKGACEGSLNQLRHYKNMQDLLDNASKWHKAYWCCWYASRVLRGPFPAGEECVSRSAEFSYLYARFAMKAPFPAGEEAVSKDAIYSYYYARDVLKASFPAGEEVISKDAINSYEYAKFVLKAPFPAGEEAISKYPSINNSYQEYLKSLEAT